MCMRIGYREGLPSPILCLVLGCSVARVEAEGGGDFSTVSVTDLQDSSCHYIDHKLRFSWIVHRNPHRLLVLVKHDKMRRN